MGNACRSTWNSWTELSREYENSMKLISSYRNKIKDSMHRKTSEELVHQEVAGSMERELKDTFKVLKSRSLYDRNSLSEEDLALPCLTDRQREVAKLRQEHSNSQVANILKLDRSVTHMIFKQALNNIEKYKKKVKEGKIVNLTPQQEKILKLHNEGLLSSEIAEKLNTSKDNVKKQLRKIRDKGELKSESNVEQKELEADESTIIELKASERNEQLKRTASNRGPRLYNKDLRDNSVLLFDRKSINSSSLDGKEGQADESGRYVWMEKPTDDSGGFGRPLNHIESGYGGSKKINAQRSQYQKEAIIKVYQKVVQSLRPESKRNLKKNIRKKLNKKKE